MKKFIIGIFIFSLIIVTGYGSLHAGNLTRIGAEADGNTTGEIPGYEGSMGLKCPEGLKGYEYHPNPYADEKELFRIDHTNVDKYTDRLTPGQIARLKKAHHLYMKIYPTRRNFELPDEYLAATEKNIDSVTMDENYNLIGYNGGVPFPKPKNGIEAVWNLKKTWGGPDFEVVQTSRLVSAKGKVKKTVQYVKSIYMEKNGRIFGEDIANPDMINAKIMAVTLFPPDEKGTAGFAAVPIDDTEKPKGWLYVPALRRVRRVPSQDTGYTTDETVDGDIVTGIGDQIGNWNWKLIGKQEKYVLANNYDIWQVDAKDKEELVPWGINPELLRYELHRVWVIEATSNEKTKNHPYSKKVGYLDEDTWALTLDDRYDRRGNLWRMGESAQLYRYCDKYREQIAFVFVNLESGRYVVRGGDRKKDSTMMKIDIGLKPKEFTTQALKTVGR